MGDLFNKTTKYVNQAMSEKQGLRHPLIMGAYLSDVLIRYIHEMDITVSSSIVHRLHENRNILDLPQKDIMEGNDDRQLLLSGLSSLVETFEEIEEEDKIDYDDQGLVENEDLFNSIKAIKSQVIMAVAHIKNEIGEKECSVFGSAFIVNSESDFWPRESHAYILPRLVPAFQASALYLCVDALGKCLKEDLRTPASQENHSQIELIEKLSTDSSRHLTQNSPFPEVISKIEESADTLAKIACLAQEKSLKNLWLFATSSNLWSRMFIYESVDSQQKKAGDYVQSMQDITSLEVVNIGTYREKRDNRFHRKNSF